MHGLKDTELKLNSTVYPRFRFGVGASFGKGRQSDYVLEWTSEENKVLVERLDTSVKAVLSFIGGGLCQYNESI